MTPPLVVQLSSLQETQSLANTFAQTILKQRSLLPLCIFCQGELGSGKTTWCRYLLQALGYQGIAPSPTYTLIESYQIRGEKRAPLKVNHIDAYRLSSPAELYNLGIEEYINDADLLLVEWGEKTADVFSPDIKIHFQSAAADGNNEALYENGNTRSATITAMSHKGKSFIDLPSQYY